MIGANFDQPPEDAIRYFRQLAPQFSTNWGQMRTEALNNSFSIAKLASLDVLQDTRNALENALSNGVPYNEFQKQFKNILAKNGWSGVKEVVDADGVVTSVKFDDPWRMRTIYRTNMQNSFSAGHWKIQQETIEAFPYGEYDAVGDRRTRPSHNSLDGKVFRMDDPFWDTHYPTNGFNCRCTVNTLTAEEVDSTDRVVETGVGNITTTQTVSSKGIKSSYSTYTDPNGRTTKTDNGWNYNVGQEFYQPKPDNYTPSLWDSVNE